MVGHYAYTRASRDGILAIAASLECHSSRQNQLVERREIRALSKTGQTLTSVHRLASRGHSGAYRDPVGADAERYNALTRCC
jgi:hypothetical protein